jgi:hypothetical protein
VPYRPRLEPSSTTNMEDAKKRKQCAGAGSLAKCERVSSQKAASAKVVVAEATPSTTSAAGCKSLAVTSARSKTVASSAASVSNIAVTVTMLRVGVLKINVRMKRLSSAPSPVAKGKQARLDVDPVLTSNAPHEVCAQPPVFVEPDEGRVAYYTTLLDSVPSELSSSSLGETSVSKSILPPPSLVQDLHVSAKVPEAIMPSQAIFLKAGAHTAVVKGLLFLAL